MDLLLTVMGICVLTAVGANLLYLAWDRLIG
jgi:hypothetical protein